MKTLFLILTLAITSFAQQPAKAEVQTKIELFQARTGVVLIKNYSEIGSMRGIGGTSTVTSWEFIDAQNAKREYGISIAVKESGRLEREERSYIDYDEN